VGARAHRPPSLDCVPRRRTISFDRALGELHGLLGRRLQVAINLPRAAFSCGFFARLESVRSLEGDDGPVLLVFGYEEGIVLDPAELTCFLVSASRPPGAAWLELHVAIRVVLLIGPAPA
jgi:hypothetical protein